ncbi:MAG: hypothetical protein ACLFN8_00660 [Candidatus Woesearchaeota archaeon]
MNKEFCTLSKLTKYIDNNKQKGLKNNEIINQLIKKGCPFQTIFNAMDKIINKPKRCK